MVTKACGTLAFFTGSRQSYARQVGWLLEKLLRPKSVIGAATQACRPPVKKVVPLFFAADYVFAPLATMRVSDL
jgi:hypothetical protein